MDPKELIAALAVLADPNASDEDKAAALDKLSAYFQSLLDAQGSDTTEGTSETGDDKPDDKDADKEKTSEAGDDKDKPAKEMSSALTSALETVKALTDRVAKLEKASAAGSAPRAAKPTVIKRSEPVTPTDPVARMIDDAVATSRRNAGNRNAGK